MIDVSWEDSGLGAREWAQDASHHPFCPYARTTGAFSFSHDADFATTHWQHSRVQLELYRMVTLRAYLYLSRLPRLKRMSLMFWSSVEVPLVPASPSTLPLEVLPSLTSFLLFFIRFLLDLFEFRFVSFHVFSVSLFTLSYCATSLAIPTPYVLYRSQSRSGGAWGLCFGNEFTFHKTHSRWCPLPWKGISSSLRFLIFPLFLLSPSFVGGPAFLMPFRDPLTLSS